MGKYKHFSTHGGVHKMQQCSAAILNIEENAATIQMIENAAYNRNEYIMQQSCAAIINR